MTPPCPGSGRHPREAICSFAPLRPEHAPRGNAPMRAWGWPLCTRTAQPTWWHGKRDGVWWCICEGRDSPPSTAEERDEEGAVAVCCQAAEWGYCEESGIGELNSATHGSISQGRIGTGDVSIAVSTAEKRFAVIRKSSAAVAVVS